MSVYDSKPDRFLGQLYPADGDGQIFCAGFQQGTWRDKQFAFHLIEWLPEYALPEDELRVHHGNIMQKLTQAAVRVYTSPKYEKRGEAGEIAIHAICRDFFGTIPLSPRVFYKSASNDVIKAFDMVHVRFPVGQPLEIWLGESKLYKDAEGAISDAIASIKAHLDAGFLENEKLLLGPQIPKTTPRYQEVLELFKKGTSLDKLISSAVFVVGIACNASSIEAGKAGKKEYIDEAVAELNYLATRLNKSTIPASVKVALLYIPLESKDNLVAEFDKKLKALQ